MHLPAKLRLAVLNQHGTLLLWLPVGLGLGGAVYFALPVEPGPMVYGALAVAIAALAVADRRLSESVWPATRLIAVILFGLLWTCLRSQWVAAPVLPWRYVGPVEGRVVMVDRSASNAVRVTLDQVRIPALRPRHTPRRVRVSLHSDRLVFPDLGSQLVIDAQLSPPGGPVEPGGFDFRRYAWFKQLGGIGYSRAPPRLIAPPEPGLGTLRQGLARILTAQMDPEPAAVARAITTGDRSRLTSAIAGPLRQSNLAHLLAISGLHMGLLAGAALVGLRAMLAVMPFGRLQRRSKKYAALGALIIAFSYLILSGAAVATERAFIMVAVMLGAVLLDRRAVTLRAVAVAATLVLLRRPEALVSPGFQLSFAATIALVVVFARLRGAIWRRPAIGLLLSSFVAGAATAPIAAAHFNIVANFGLIANLLSVPVMASLVMPLVLICLVLAPFGMHEVAVWAMEAGLVWILGVAQEIASWPGAVRYVAAPHEAALPAFMFGALVMCLWQGRARWGGGIVMLCALALWPFGGRPQILVSQSGKLVGVMTADGRSVSQPRGDGFAASVWLENDGTPGNQQAAAQRLGWRGSGHIRTAHAAGITIAHRRGKRAMKGEITCDGADVIVTDQRADADLGCIILDAEFLSANGAVSLARQSTRIQITTARAQAGLRVWNTPAMRWRQ